MEILHTRPEDTSFVLLAEHQARTPSSFYSGPPVLYYHSKQCKVVVLERDLRASPALRAIRGSTETGLNGSGTTSAMQEVNDDSGAKEEGGEEGKEIFLDGVDVWVTSDKFLLYSHSTSSGVSIPYPSISLHAIQRLRLPNTESQVQGLYMQIAIPETASQEQIQQDEEEPSTTLTIVPPTGPEMVDTSTAEATQLTTAELSIQEDLSDGNKPDETPTQMLYAAVSACSNLHPDPAVLEEGGDGDDDEDGNGVGIGGGENAVRGALFQAGFGFPGGADGDGNGDNGLPPPVDGSSGWITAENMHEYFDEDGNWIAGGEAPGFLQSPLGPGAGNVRQREAGENGHGDGGEGGEVGEDGNVETKWRRTEDS